MSLLRISTILVLLAAIAGSSSILGASMINRLVERSVHESPGNHRVTAQLRLASSFDPDNPQTLWLLAESETDASKRLAYLERISQRQPNRAQAWAEIFSHQVTRGVTDKKMDMALQSALSLGGWDPAIQARIVDSGTRFWVMLDDSQRRLVLEAAGRRLVSASEWRRQDVVDILRDRGFLKIVCQGLTGVEQPTDTCKSVQLSL